MPSVVTNFKISNNGKVSFDKVNINGYCWKYGAELSSVACS
ncbi:MAG: hypothetical protein RR904_03045 [Bacilli bacterium]